MYVFKKQQGALRPFVGLFLSLIVAGVATAQTTVVLRGTVGGADQGRVNNDPETGLKVRTPADSDFTGVDWHTGSVASGDAFGDAGDGRLVLEFDLSSIPPGESITGATLHVFLPTDAPPFLVRFGNDVIAIRSHHLTVTNDGIVTTGDYDGASTDLGSIIPAGVDPFGADPSEYTLDVTAAVSADHVAGNTFSAFRLQSDPTFNDKSDHYLGVVTETYASAAFRPFLEVTRSGSPPPGSPTDIAPDSFSVDENTDTTGGFSLGALTTTDPDSGETFTYAILPGADSALFSIGGAGFDELILDDGLLDAESKASYTVAVQVTDSTSNTYAETLTVTVNDLNESPTDIAPDSFSVAENTDTAGGFSLGTLNTTDPDSGETFSYAIGAGGDGALFSIGGAGLDELILDDGVLDTAIKASYSVTVQVTDSASNTYFETLTVNVVPVAGQVFTDDFNRTLLGPNWDDGSGSFTIVSDQLVEFSGNRYFNAQMPWLGGETETSDQFAKLQVIDLASHTFGFMFRVGDPSGLHYEVHLPQGSAEWRWELLDPDFVGRIGDCVGDQVLSNGDWIGAKVEGTGASTVVSAWRWDTDPGNDPASRGPPDCQMTQDPAPAVDLGRGVGIRAYTGSSTSSGFADNWSAGDVSAPPPPPPPPPTGAIDVSDLVGSNGFPGLVGSFQHDTTSLWQEMGVSFYRHDVVWGEVEASQDVFDFSPTNLPFALNHDSIISTSAANGFKPPLVMLVFTAPWASTGPPAGPNFRAQYQSFYPPQNVADWQDYVDRTVQHFMAPPYNVQYFEVWNEPYAEFWTGTKEQYVDMILIPAAQIVHSYGGKVVAPAWAGASPQEMNDWLNYNNAWQHVDILSVHFNWADRDIFYSDWLATGKLEGLWYTEVSGFVEAGNPYFIADLYPEAMDWFLRHDWSSPDKYKIIYWTDGVTLSTGEFLINQDASQAYLTDQGKAMRTFTDVFSEPLDVYAGSVVAPGVTASYAFKTATKVIVALEGVGAGTVLTVGDLGSQTVVDEVLATDVVSGNATALLFTQTGSQVDVQVPAGDAYRYVSVGISVTGGLPTAPTDLTVSGPN